jgi:hypothetical protein
VAAQFRPPRRKESGPIDVVRSANDMMTAQCCAGNNETEMSGCCRKGKVNLSEQLRVFGMRPVAPEVRDFHVNALTYVCF